MRLFARWRKCAWCRKEPIRLWMPTLQKRKVGFCSSACATAYQDDENKQIQADLERKARAEAGGGWDAVGRSSADHSDGSGGAGG